MTTNIKSIVEKITPVLVVDSVSASAPFWEALGFQREAEVPHGDTLGFVLLSRGGVEVMLQSRDSLASDVPAIAASRPEIVLYAEVTSLDQARASLRDATVVFEERRTPYGAREIGVREPGGRLVMLGERTSR